MVPVRMREDDIFDLVGIQPKLLQAAENLVFSSVVEQSFDDDYALASDERPCAVNLGANEVEVIGDPGRFRVPGFPRRSCPVSRRPAGGNAGGGTQSRRKVPAQSVPAAAFAVLR